MALRESSWDNDLKVRIEKASIQQEAILKEGRDEIGKSARTMEEINIAEKKLQEKATVVFNESITAFAHGVFGKTSYVAPSMMPCVQLLQIWW